MKNIWPVQILLLYSLHYFEAALLGVQMFLIGDYVSALTLFTSLCNPLCIYIYDDPK